LERSIKPLLPDLFAAKAGTTLVAEILNQHPEICFTIEKELKYFSVNEYYKYGISFFSRYYKHYNDEPYVCDVSLQYLYFTKSISRIKETYPEPDLDNLKFIVVLRDPLTRTYSSYWQAVRHGIEHGTIEDALENEKMRLKDIEF
jgi:hypothetical protein